MKHLFLVILFAFFFVGCDSGNSNSFDDWMKCPTKKTKTTADLAWIDFDATCNYNPLPGDTILLNIQVRNNNPNHDTPDIPKSSVLRVFMENVDADLSTIGTIGPEDWFIGEFVIPALLEDERYSTLEVVEIPLTSSFLT